MTAAVAISMTVPMTVPMAVPMAMSVVLMMTHFSITAVRVTI